MAFLNPTTNAYRRIHREALRCRRWSAGATTTACAWCACRASAARGDPGRGARRRRLGQPVPGDRGGAVRRPGRDPPQARAPAGPEGLIYEQPEAENCTPLPRSFDAALEALDADAYLNEAMGEELVRVFLEIKGAELDRARNAYVTDWEFAEYTHHL